jgi:bacterioferritin-associated ferredoxin
MAVNRCMCTGTTFAQVKRCAEETGASYEQVLEMTRCGEGCGLCLPYIKLVLLSGLVDLPVLTPEVYKRLIAQYTQSPTAQPPRQCCESREEHAPGMAAKAISG